MKTLPKLEAEKLTLRIGDRRRASAPLGRRVHGTQGAQEQHPPHLGVHHGAAPKTASRASPNRIRPPIVDKNQSVDSHLFAKNCTARDCGIMTGYDDGAGFLNRVRGKFRSGKVVERGCVFSCENRSILKMAASGSSRNYGATLSKLWDKKS